MKRLIIALILATTLLMTGVMPGEQAFIGTAHADGGDGGEG